MADLTNAAESDIMKLIFQAINWSKIADNAGTTPETNLDTALHTADPGEAGDMTANEATYTGYARKEVARTTGGWSESSGVVSPVANIDFPQNTGASQTLTHFSVGRESDDYAIVHGDIDPDIVANTNDTPRLSTSTTITAN